MKVVVIENYKEKEYQNVTEVEFGHKEKVVIKFKDRIRKAISIKKVVKIIKGEWADNAGNWVG